MARLTTAQVNRLGERLRAATVVSEEDLTALQQFRTEHEDALVEVQERISRILPGVDQTARVKTIQTLHDKLRRQPTRLSRVHDIVGVRLVLDIGLLDQDRIVGMLVAEFPDARVIDRRVRPSYGYRAVHVIVQVGRCHCEIQVRTEPQHLWAEIVERLGDRWGRGIRYGDMPPDPERDLGGLTRQELWDLVQEVGELTHALESEAQGGATGEDHGALGADSETVRLARQQVRQMLDRLLRLLERDVAL